AERALPPAATRLAVGTVAVGRGFGAHGFGFGDRGRVGRDRGLVRCDGGLGFARSALALRLFFRDRFLDDFGHRGFGGGRLGDRLGHGFSSLGGGCRLGFARGTLAFRLLRGRDLFGGRLGGGFGDDLDVDVCR